MPVFHRWLGATIVAALFVIAVWGLGMKIARREKAPTAYWGLQHYTENALVLQILVGVTMLILGHRVTGDSLVWLHYLYGSVFPLIAIVGGRISGLRRERQEYVGLVWGAFFAWGLTMRAIMTACGNDLTHLGVCFGLR